MTPRDVRAASDSTQVDRGETIPKRRVHVVRPLRNLPIRSDIRRPDATIVLANAFDQEPMLYGFDQKCRKLLIREAGTGKSARLPARRPPAQARQRRFIRIRT